MTELYEDEKAKACLHTGSDSPKTLMRLLVCVSQDEAKSGGGLTESEIYGNVFMLNLAGHNTTAHSLTFAIHFLAANPAI